MGMKIHVDHYKPISPKGRAILFHGVGGNGRLLSCIALPLMRNGYEVVCPDLPLYGYTQYSQTITYNTWISCGTELVKHYQSMDDLPTFLFGFSAGGMLAYQIVCECTNIRGLIVSCILDQRMSTVTRNTANNLLMGMVAKPLISAIKSFAGNVKIPMKCIGNMKAIVNNAELATILMRDKKSSGVMVPLIFVHTMLNPIIKIEPEKFKCCPVLLVHPEEDHWTDIRLSNLFYNRLACEKQTVILKGAGHFPIEDMGLKQMEHACISFLQHNL